LTIVLDLVIALLDAAARELLSWVRLFGQDAAVVLVEESDIGVNPQKGQDNSNDVRTSRGVNAGSSFVFEILVGLGCQHAHSNEAADAVNGREKDHVLVVDDGTDQTANGREQIQNTDDGVGSSQVVGEELGLFAVEVAAGLVLGVPVIRLGDTSNHPEAREDDGDDAHHNHSTAEVTAASAALFRREQRRMWGKRTSKKFEQFVESKDFREIHCFSSFWKWAYRRMFTMQRSSRVHAHHSRDRMRMQHPVHAQPHAPFARPSPALPWATRLG